MAHHTKIRDNQPPDKKTAARKSAVEAGGAHNTERWCVCVSRVKRKQTQFFHEPALLTMLGGDGGTSRPATADPAAAAASWPEQAPAPGSRPQSAMSFRPRTASTAGRKSTPASRPRSAASSVGSGNGGRISAQGMRSLSRSMLLEQKQRQQDVDRVTVSRGVQHKPKSARWLREDDQSILKFPVGTFDTVAEKVRPQPTASMGHTERFSAKSHFAPSDGPIIGPGYDVQQAHSKATVPRTGGPIYRPNIHSTSVANERLPMPGTEAADQIYNHTDTFRAAGADRHHGQAARCRHTGGYGTSARFQTQAGGAGGGHQSYIRRCQTAGVGMQNIRDWPAKKSQVRVERYHPGGDMTRLQHRKGFGGYGGCGADALYDIPSACFEGASLVAVGAPTRCMGTEVSLRGYRHDH